MQRDGDWSIGLERKVEAQALLAAQATGIGNQVLSTTDTNYDRTAPGIRAIELLRFAELVLPDTKCDNSEIVEFPLGEAQHLSGLLYGATRAARITRTTLTEYDNQLSQMEDEIQAFFGMD